MCGVARSQHPPIHQDRNAVGKLEHRVHVVLDEQDGGVAAQALDQAQHLQRVFRPHARHRLVEQQQPGPGSQRQCHVELLLHAVGQGAGGALEHRGEAKLGCQLQRARHQLAFAVTSAQTAKTGAGLGLHREQQVVAHRVIAEHAGDLKAAPKAGARALVGRKRTQIGAVEQHPPRIGWQQPGDQIHQGGFARAIGADQGVDLARLHRQADMIGRQQATKALHQAIGHEQAHASALPARSCAAPSTSPATSAPCPPTSA